MESNMGRTHTSMARVVTVFQGSTSHPRPRQVNFLRSADRKGSHVWSCEAIVLPLHFTPLGEAPGGRICHAHVGASCAQALAGASCCGRTRGLFRPGLVC
jgi:hypothetical protein